MQIKDIRQTVATSNTSLFKELVISKNTQLPPASTYISPSEYTVLRTPGHKIASFN